MKYSPKSKSLDFSSDAEASAFHDQLTELMRIAMSTVGDSHTSEADASKLTMDFFERYAILTDALCRLRAHMHRKIEE
ncbi:MAG: hypothetical protein PHP70_04820 [Gallionella sp.]|nr:hypothetical protein [Gallionella sp.]